MMLAAVLGALFFALAAVVGVLVGNATADSIEPFDDAPAPAKAPAAVLVAACALVGAIVVTRTADPLQIAIVAIVCAVLAAIWCCDARTGIIPDAFTLLPLGALLALAVWQHAWWVCLSAFAVFVPFAVAALVSRGIGMGWGDVKLAALGGAVLGAELSLVTFSLACIVAVVVNFVVQRRSGAIALGPYLAAAIGIAIPIGLLR